MDSMDRTTAGEELTKDRGPTPAERQALARAYQQQAMARSEPLSANLGTIMGDLMSFAYFLASQVQSQMSQGVVAEEKHQRFVEDTELYLKMVRQLDRLAQVERQFSTRPAERS